MKRSYRRQTNDVMHWQHTDNICTVVYCSAWKILHMYS